MLVKVIRMILRANVTKYDVRTDVIVSTSADQPDILPAVYDSSVSVNSLGTVFLSWHVNPSRQNFVVSLYYIKKYSCGGGVFTMSSYIG